jgi:membrane-associated phospholipid phosphatase
MGPMSSSRRDTAASILSGIADWGLIWLLLWVVMWAAGGKTRLAGQQGLLSFALSSALVNGPLKLIWRRERPNRPIDEARRALVRPMRSSSFPSGHSAAAFAFATGAGLEAPTLLAPLALLATGIAYSRVHSRVHFVSDVLVGSAIGVASALAVRRLLPHSELPSALEG